MADIEKVMAGLECCDKQYGDHEGCPYDHKDPYGDYEYATCILALIHDAKEVLTEQVSLIHFLNHQRQKGHWVFGSSNGHSWMKCSECLVSQDGQTACFSFCPNCGASMEEEPEHYLKERLMKNRDYPIILGHKYRKGILALRDYHGLGGFTFLFCRLKKEVQTGSRFDLDDVESVETELVFTDRESLECTIKVMKDVLKLWKKTDR